MAFIQCAGSRDQSMGVPYCSRVCCMYAIKQAMLLSGSLPLADMTIYYMDIRAFGKGYEQFFQNAQAMGVNFVKGKVAYVEPGDRRGGAAALRIPGGRGRGAGGRARPGGAVPGPAAGVAAGGPLRPGHRDG